MKEHPAQNPNSEFPNPKQIRSAKPETSFVFRLATTVAQISNLLYRRIPFGSPSDVAGGGGLEIRDTAGWKPALPTGGRPLFAGISNVSRLAVVACLAFLAAFSARINAADTSAKPRNLTFISTSDSHYREVERKEQTERNHITILEMNKVSALNWPEKIGGDKIETPRGAVMLGDCIDDGDRVINGKHVTPEQNRFFLADFGLDGTDGVLKYPVFETWGNHDGPPEGKDKNGFSFQAQIKKRNQVRKEKGFISNVSENGLHYSWDWDDVHFVQLGIYPADKQREGVRYSPVWHDPQGALSFLKQDLAAKVGQSGRPVVLMSHCGFDTDWWVPADWKELYDAGKSYNVILYLYGHSGTGLRDWAPEGETKKWMCINDGNTTTGFFIIQIQGDRIRAGYRCKEGVKITRQPDKTEKYEWDGQWGWRFLLDRKLIEPVLRK